MGNENSGAKGDIWGAVKWICIAIVAVLIAFGIYKAYKIATKPAVVVADATEKMTEAAKSGGDVIADKTDQLLNRLSITVDDAAAFNEDANTTFSVLTDLPAVESVTLKEKLFVRTELGGNLGYFCRISMDFGAGEVPVYAAADNKAYQTAKSLGGVGDRLMRFVVRTPNDDVGVNIESAEGEGWTMRWRPTTLKKPIDDATAAKRVSAIMEAIPKACL